MCNFFTVWHSTPENCAVSCILQEASVGFAQMHGVVLQSPLSPPLPKKWHQHPALQGFSHLPVSPCHSTKPRAMGTTGLLLAREGKLLGEQVV